jgi:hypothetical protein
VRSTLQCEPQNDKGTNALAKPIEPDRKTATPTLNQRVHGSSPCAPTIEIKD